MISHDRYMSNTADHHAADPWGWEEDEAYAELLDARADANRDYEDGRDLR